MKKIKSQHRAVARYLAYGYELKNICKQFALNLTTWQRIVNQPLFQQAQKEFENEIIDIELESQVHNKITARLLMEADNNITTLVAERDGLEKNLGQTGTTRIAAAKALSDMAGFKEIEKIDLSHVMYTALSKDQLDAIHSAKKPEAQPESITG